MLTLQSDNPRTFFLRSLVFPKNQGAHRDEHDFHLGAQAPALAVCHRARMNGHRFRGSHHGTMNIHHAMYARDGRLVIEIQSAAGSASMQR